MASYPVSEINKVIRGNKRATYNVQEINNILDATFLCHIGYVWQGKSIVIPMAYGRDNNSIYIHGSLKNRMMISLLESGEASISVTLLDGLVLARSAFHHSANYRSVSVFGKVRKVEDADEKMKALECILNHMVPGHWDEVRKPNEKEFNATLVMALEIETASAKIRAEGAVDEKDDMELPIWAGVVPIRQIAGEVEPDKFLPSDIEMPKSVRNCVNSFGK